MTRIIAIILFAIWFVLALLGKGGFVHLLLVAAFCVAIVDVVAVYRSRTTVTNADRA
jgi:hypothetical protein